MIPQADLEAMRARAVKTLAWAESQSASESATQASLLCLDHRRLLDAYDELRTLARELALNWRQFRHWDCLNPLVIQDPCSHMDLYRWRDMADSAIAKARAAGVL
jgi:hypothetical protein